MPSFSGYDSYDSESTLSVYSSDTSKSDDSLDKLAQMMGRKSARHGSCRACSPPPDAVIARPPTVPQGHTPQNSKRRAEARMQLHGDKNVTGRLRQRSTLARLGARHVTSPSKSHKVNGDGHYIRQHRM
jgi:hypothetical protein